MARVEDGAVARLHYALTDSQCSNCGAQLEWNAVFDNISLPKYIAKHCGQIYTISVETVKFDVHDEKDAKQEKVSEGKEPRAILMAKRMKRRQQESAARKGTRTAKEA
jgi:hypothetical protein